jgi:hypothetical protein
MLTERTDLFAGRSRVSRVGFVALSVVAVAAGALAAPAARAQWQMFSLADRPPVTERVTNTMERVVELDEGQVALVASLQQEAEAEFARIAEIMESIQEDAREEGRREQDRTVWIDLFVKLREFVEHRDEVREDFLDNAELVVRPEQQDRWERFERRYFRQSLYNESAAQYGSVPGVTVDIEEVVETAELDEGTVSSLRPMLDQYSRDVNTLLRELDEAADENIEARVEAFRVMTETGQWDREMMEQGMDRIGELVESVRELNIRYERQIAGQLEGEARASFQRVYNKTAFPGIYRDDIAAGRFRTALERDDLTDEQRRTLEDLRASFRREADAIRARLRAEALDENPIEEFARSGFRFGGRDDESDDDEEALRELNARYVDQINNVLTPKQREEMGSGDPTDWRNRSFEQ